MQLLARSYEPNAQRGVLTERVLEDVGDQFVRHIG